MNEKPARESGAKRASAKRSALETAAALLAARACTKKELRDKLKKKGVYTYPEIAHAISELERMGYLSDRRYAEDAVGILRSRGFGPLRIRAKLLSKGIERDLLEELMSAPGAPGEEEDDLARALSLLERNGRRFEKDEPPKRKQRALRFLAGKGFPASIVYQAEEKWEKGLGGSSNDEPF
ncbi:MAG: regulatory protein RecX [Lentisphaeria bacterium]|nr:regulatory protein RecX [Lentisphaeria bacterium]